MTHEVTDTVFETLREQLASFGQSPVLRFWDELSDRERSDLAADIQSIDLRLVDELVRGEVPTEDWDQRSRRATPPPAFRVEDRRENSTMAELETIGRELLAAGKVGTVLVAGGQGTRLGFDHPKGMYPIGPVSGASLFQLLFEQLIAVRRTYDVPIPLYLMTSGATHHETIEFLEANDHFGLPADDVFIFCQGMMPSVDMESSELLLAEKSRLALSPDGHGGTLAALERSGGLADINRRGIEHLFYFQVDNPLVTVCDEAFLGYHAKSGSEMSTQVVAKTAPKDRVGNVVVVDGKVAIIEYSDLPDDVAEKRGEDGNLLLWAGNIAVHAFSVAFLDSLVSRKQRLPFHYARKAVPYVDAQGESVEPDEPNAIKFEQFIFDLLPAAGNAVVYEVKTCEAFAPVKNEPGESSDTPELAQRLMVNLDRRRLESLGVQVAEGVDVEVSPLLSRNTARLKSFLGDRSEISETCYLRDEGESAARSIPSTSG